MSVIYLGDYMQNKIGLRILRALADLDMNQSELAREMDVAVQSVQQWVRQYNPKHPKRRIAAPEGKRLERLAKVLKRSKTWILFGIEDNYSELELTLLTLVKTLPDTHVMDIIKHTKWIIYQLDERLPKKATK